MIMSCYNSVIKKGKDCIAVVHNALDDIDSGRKRMALQKLSSLQKDGELLVYAAEQLTERLEAVDRYFQKKDSEKLREISNLAKRETQLKSQKLEEESQLAAQRSRLQDNEYRLSSAEEDLRNAKRRRRKAEEEEKERVLAGSIVGGVLGVLTFGIGGLVGAAVGAGFSAIVNSCMKEEEKAEAVVDRRRNDRDNARSTVDESMRRVANVESQITNLTKDIHRTTQQRQISQQKVKNVRSLIVIAKKSVVFWQLFQQISKNGIDRTDLLQTLVTMAANKEECQALKSESSQFIEAWEKIEALAESGGPNHILETKYRCSRCSVQCTALPHIIDTAFVCMKCYSKYALK